MLNLLLDWFQHQSGPIVELESLCPAEVVKLRKHGSYQDGGEAKTHAEVTIDVREPPASNPTPLPLPTITTT
jgi:hypothetical protein